MWYKRTPLEKFFWGFKIFTCSFATFYSILVAIAGLMFLSSGTTGVYLLLHAALAYWCGQSIEHSMESEQRKRRLGDEDESSEDPPGTV